MLRRTTCSSHGRLGSCVLSLQSSFLQPRADLANRIFQASVKHRASLNTRRFASTQQDNTDRADSAGDPPSATDNNSYTDLKSPEEHTETRVRDVNESGFTLTPRFQWRLRRKFPGDDGSTKQVSKQAGHMQHFSPTRSDEQAQGLQSILSSLDSMAEELRVMAMESRVPLSPLEKRVKEQGWEPKRQPTKEETRKLSYNPWAMMLAGRMRTDAASRVRFPDPLLLEMAPVANLADDSNYIMPDDLANLEEFDKRLQKGLRRLAMADLHRERGGGTINILPERKMMDELTDELVVWQASTKSVRTKNGSIMKRIIPPKWMERNIKLNAYQNASKEYWDAKEKGGELNDALSQKPVQPLDLTTLKWQPNIVGRMLSLMRQRLLLSIDHLGRKTDMPFNIPRRHFLCFSWPDPLYIDIATKLAELNQEDSIAAQQSSAPREADDPDSKHPALKAGARNQTVDRSSDPHLWLPGSFFLHMGPAEKMSLALPYLRQIQSSPMDDPTTQTNISKLIPPMISVANGYRVPVFNLQTLLGPDFDHPLRQILAQHNMVKQNRDESISEDYLVLIRGTAPGSHYITQELWQLWRYLGGTDSFLTQNLPTAETPSEPTTPQQDKMIAGLKRIKSYTTSETAWNHFYSFLPNIKREKSDT